MERRNIVMNWRIIPVLIALAFIGIAASGPSELFASSGSAGEVIVICNDSVTASSLSKDDIQEIFLGRKTRWDDGQKITLAILKEGPTNDLFLNEYVEKTPSQFLNYWKKQAFTGRGRVPDTFSTPEELADFVKKTPGAIGYIPPNAYQNQFKSITIE